jgi:peptidoglycan-associated lipoprotein
MYLVHINDFMSKILFNLFTKIGLKLVFLLITLLQFSQFACTPSATKAYNKGLVKQTQGENDAAIEFFKISASKGGNVGKLSYLIAENYRVTNRLVEAAPYYTMALKNKVKEEKILFYYAQAMEATGNYIESRINFDKYAKTGANSFLVAQARAKVKFLRNIHEIINKEVNYEVKNAGEFINTEGPEYAPLLDPNGELIYTASNNQFVYKATGTGFTDIYKFKFDGSPDNSGVKTTYEEKINQNQTHEACPAIAPDGTFIIFVRSNTGKRKGGTDTDLYIMEMQDGVWGTPKVLPISDPRYWESTPALSPDGKTLYFASNRKGGLGGVDLYKSFLSDSGWTKPENLGEPINSPGNEMFPSVRKDGKFFFSSDGHAGLGGLDIFVCLKDTTKSEEDIVNLGAPINSNSDDFGITYKKDQKNGYFSSNRSGGKGDDDIYTFYFNPIPRKTERKEVYAFLTIKTTRDDASKLPIDSASISIKFDSGEIYADTISNQKGYAFFEIDTNTIYQIQADKAGFFSNSISFNTKTSLFKEEAISTTTFNRYYQVVLSLSKAEVGKEVVLKNIFYDYNKANIRPDAEPDLLMLVEFLKKNPTVDVELGSHTDARGNDEYNLKLSEARAKSAVDFIVKNGIEPSRIRPVGYGETKHLVEEAQTEEEHQLNRRTEFKIVKM